MKVNKKQTKKLEEILKEFNNDAIKHGYDDLNFTEAELLLRDRNRTRIRKELPGAWFRRPLPDDINPPKSVNERLETIENGISDLNYKMILILDSLSVNLKEDTDNEEEG